MVEAIIFVLLTITLIYVAKINFKKYEKVEEPIKTIPIVLLISKLVQLLIIIYVSIGLFQISYYLLNNGEMPVLKGIFKVNEVKSFTDWGTPVLILFGITNNIIYFVILEFINLLLKDYIKKISFNEQNTKRLVMIANLFIIKIFISIIINYLERGVLYFSFEYLLIYGLMLVLIRLFTYAKLMQEDSSR